MEKKCDVVVIGAGIGGLCAGARLASKGLKTVILEQLSITGGRFTTFVYKGFKIPGGAWCTPFGNTGPIGKTIKEVGGKEVEYKYPMPFHAYKIRGEEYGMPERGMIPKLISLAAEDKKEEERVVNAITRAVKWQEPPDSISFRDWLLQYTENELIHNIFRALIGMQQGLPPSEEPAGVFIRLMRLLSRRELPRDDPRWIGTTGLSENGCKDVIDSLENAFLEKKGELMLKTKANEIVVEDGVAKGVIAEREGERVEIEAKFVISDTAPRKTVDLAGKKNFERGYLRELREKLRPAVGTNFFFSTKKPLIKLPVAFMMTPDASRLSFVSDLSLTWPSYSPEGMHTLYGMTVPASTLMFDLKKEIELGIEDFKNNFPDLEKYGELLLVQNFHRDWPIFHSWPGCDLPQKTPIENLYNVGDGVKPPEYFAAEAVADSARVVVEDILSRI